MHNTGPSKLNHSLKLIILSLLGAGLLAGCGIRGSLKVPPPLFGPDAKTNADRVPTESLDDSKDEDELDLLGPENYDDEDALELDLLDDE